MTSCENAVIATRHARFPTTHLVTA